MQTINLAIEGMHCGACATGIQMLVSQMDGVQNIFVEYPGKPGMVGKGTVTYDEGKVDTDKIIQEVAQLGYSAKKMD